jgi:hypothetical protein
MTKKQPEKPVGLSDLDELGWIGHAVPALLGLLALVGAFFSYESGIQPTLTVSLIVAGTMLPVLAWFSLQRSRAAWSFLVALSIVLGIMTLFGAPKVRTLVGIHMALALVIPGLFALAAFALSVQSHRYKT